MAVCLSACNGLFYFPSRSLYSQPPQTYRDVSIPTDDGHALHGWWLPATDDALGTVVQFHGNAGNVSSHFRALSWVTEHRLSLLTFDYRGYGASPGRPSPAGLDRDARAAIRFAQTLPHGRWQSDLVLVGQSLGGAVLLSAYGRLSDRRRVRAVVVEGAFHSYSEMAGSVLWNSVILFPFAGFGYALVSDAYAPARVIDRVQPTPLLVIHGTRDRIVPPAFGRVIHELARPPKQLWLVPGAGHIGVFRSRSARERWLRYLAEL